MQHPDVPDKGVFVPPTVVAVDDPGAPLARDEVFGPVLTVLRAPDMDGAIALANRSDYALTAGVYSRSPAAIAAAAQRLRAGNVYVNRPITGAVVSRQPFGATACRASGRRRSGPTTCCSSSIPGSSPRTPSGRAAPDL